LKVAVVLGTRPEMVKMSPVIRELRSRGVNFFILHTGQHYDYKMDGAFFNDLTLPEPEHNLGVGSGSHAEQTGRIMVGIEKILSSEHPDITLVQGDTNTVLGGALVAAKLHKKIGHVEAGLRSFDRAMPEEINRVVADHVSDYLFAPTPVSKRNLLNEGIDDRKIYVTGNTVVDALKQNLALSLSRADALKDLGLEEGGYFLVTLHRAENVDDKARLRNIMRALRQLGKKYRTEVVFPVHPRTRKMMKTYGLSPKGIETTNPLGYLEFIQLESRARLILTDSGGVQEEACILGVPCVTLRDNTERPETVEVGANIVAGIDPATILSSAQKILERERSWENPFGDGEAGKRIVDIITNRKKLLLS